VDARHHHRRSDCRVGAGLDRRCKHGVDVMTIKLYSPFESGNKSTASVSVLRDKDGGEWHTFRGKRNLWQGAKFYQPKNPLAGEMFILVYNGENCVVELTGRVVHNLICSIVQDSNKFHLIKLRRSIDERLEKFND